MRFLITQIWINERIGTTDIVEKPTLRKRRNDLKRIKGIEESKHEDTGIGTCCYNKFDDYLFTVNIPFEEMNTYMNRYYSSKKRQINLIWNN